MEQFLCSASVKAGRLLVSVPLSLQLASGGVLCSRAPHSSHSIDGLRCW